MNVHAPASAAQRLPVLQTFIDELRAIWRADSDVGRCMEKAKPVLEKLVRDPDLQARSADWPSTEGRKNLLLYVDEEHGFAINAVVRVPGRKGSVHDHAHAWVLYGVLQGSESLERYERIDDRSRPDYAQVRMTSVSQGVPGKVDLVAPFDIHAEQGGPGRSVAIIVRSAKLGEITQNQYDPETGAIRPGPGPTQIPFELTA
jgi:predicted metal-dependent enzyme (double-stranded beta helix superfamily)